LNAPFWMALTECAMELMHGKAPGFPSWCNDVARSTEALLASLGRPAARQMDSSAYHVDRMLSSPQESKLLEEISKLIPPTQLGDDKLKTGKNTKIGLSMADRLQALLCGVYRRLKFQAADFDKMIDLLYALELYCNIIALQTNETQVR